MHMLHREAQVEIAVDGLSPRRVAILTHWLAVFVELQAVHLGASVQVVFSEAALYQAPEPETCPPPFPGVSRVGDQVLRIGDFRNLAAGKSKALPESVPVGEAGRTAPVADRRAHLAGCRQPLGRPGAAGGNAHQHVVLGVLFCIRHLPQHLADDCEVNSATQVGAVPARGGLPPVSGLVCLGKPGLKLP